MPTQHHRVETGWTQIASGPALIESTGETLFIHFGVEAPASESRAYHVLSTYRGLAMTYSGNTSSWARANHGVVDVIVTEASQ